MTLKSKYSTPSPPQIKINGEETEVSRNVCLLSIRPSDAVASPRIFHWISSPSKAFSYSEVVSNLNGNFSWCVKRKTVVGCCTWKEFYPIDWYELRSGGFVCWHKLFGLVTFLLGRPYIYILIPWSFRVRITCCKTKNLCIFKSLLKFAETCY